MAKTRIVLLDDHPAIAHATSTLLEMAGYKVECFHSVAELENVQYSNPDLYLLDRHLPFKGGLELCTELKSDPLKSHIPVVIMSALRDTHILTRKAGGDAFLAKPFTRQDLISLVQLLTHNGSENYNMDNNRNTGNDGRNDTVPATPENLPDGDQISAASWLRAIMEAAIDFAIITTDRNGIIIDWNSGAEKIFGYSREEVRGSATDIIFTPEDRAGGLPAQELEIARSTGRSVDERWHLRKDGTRFFMSGVMTPVALTQDLGFVKISRNITDRKLAEEALMLSEQRKNMAVQSAGMGEWEWDLQTNVVTLNDQALLLLGWGTERSGLTDNPLIGQAHQLDRPAVEAALQRAKDGIYIFHTEYRIIRDDNQQASWINVYGRVVNHESQEALKMIGVVYDINSRKLLEKQKDDFISVASHELKTPVTAIKVYSEILRERFSGTVENENVHLLDLLNNQVDQLMDLVKTLLDSSALNEGRIALHPEVFDLNESITTRVQQLGVVLPLKNIRCELSQVPSIRADRERILQVITNFLTNAAKYAPQSEEVVVRTEDLSDRIKMSVQDFGNGIPLDAQPHLFDRYYRTTDAAREDGFGLGLYISSRIIEQHFGEIGVISVPGQGATFFFTLPYT